MFRRLRFLSLMVLSLTTLAACGGGGGGGGGGGAGAFTLDRSSVAFAAGPNQATPAPQSVVLDITGSGAAFAGAGYRNGTPPAWLDVSVSGSGSRYTFVFRITTTALPQGDYSAVVTLGTADSDGNLLQTQDVSVRFSVGTRLALSGPVGVQPFILGSSQTGRLLPLGVTAAATTTWSARSSAPWLIVPSGSFTGPGALEVTVDASTLGLGPHSASVQVTNLNDPTESATFVFDVSVDLPTLAVSNPQLTIGDEDGRDITNPVLQFSLDTGVAVYPWTAVTDTDDGGSWLRTDLASGTVAGAGAQIQVIADRNAVQGGRYFGNLRLQAEVQGHVLVVDVPVTFNKEAERLNVMSDGVALSKLPSRELLTRQVEVRSTLDRTDVPWTASADQAWLQVTSSGLTGEHITLTADPSGLAADTTHIANVTLESPEAAIENTQSIRVGLWVGSSDPVDQVQAVASEARVASSPVEPLVFVHTHSSAVSVYNVYTGAVERTLPLAIARPRSMAISSDGRILYIADHDSTEVVAVDAQSGDELDRFPYFDGVYLGSAEIAYARPGALPALLLGNGTLIDLGSGNVHDADIGYYDGGRPVVSADSRELYIHNFGLSPSTVYHYRIIRSSLGAEPLALQPVSARSPGSNGRDLAVSPDGAKVYSASGSPYNFPVLDGETLQPIRSLPGTAYPNNAETAWNGVFAGGADAYYDPTDIWVYAANDNLLGTLRCEGSSLSRLLTDSVRFSGDALRLACATQNGPGAIAPWTLSFIDVPGS